MTPKLSALDQFIAARIAFTILARPNPPETRDEAAQLLGVDPFASESEINRAYKDLARKSHPDYHGDSEESTDRMTELNVARDILTGKRSEPPRYESSPGTGGPSTGNPRTEVKETYVPLAKAMSSEGVPSGVQWIFASNTGKGDRDMGATDYYGIVYYGKTSSSHVFLGIWNEHGQNMFEMRKTNIWSCFVKEVPISQSLDEVAPREIRNMFMQFSGLRKGYNAKVTILPDNFSITEGTALYPKGQQMSFKDAMVNLGLVGDEHRWKTNQKLKVVMTFHEKYGSGEPEYGIDIVINGRVFKLNDANVAFFTRNYNRNLGVIFGKATYDGSSKEITRSPKGKKILEDLTKTLKGEPQELLDLLAQAASQMK